MQTLGRTHLLDNFFAFTRSVQRSSFLHLCKCIALECVPTPQVQKHLAAIAYHLSDSSDVQHARIGRVQGIDHVGIVFHHQLKEVYDVVDVQVVLFICIRILDVMLLKDAKAIVAELGFSEADNLTP